MPSFTDFLRSTTRTAERLSRQYPRSQRLMDLVTSRLIPEQARNALNPSRALAIVGSAIGRVVDRGLRHFLGDQRVDALQGLVGRFMQGRSTTLSDLAEQVIDRAIYNVLGEQGAVTQGADIESAIRTLFTDYPSRIVGDIETAVTGRIEQALGGRTATNREMWQLAIDRHVARSRENLRNIASEMVAGRISPQQFRERMAAELRQLHLGASILGSGGILNVSEYHIQQLEGRLRQQMAFLDQFVRDTERRLARGLPLNQRDIARSGLYSGAGRVTFFQSQRQFIANSTNDGAVERRVLNSALENCVDCQEYAAMSWQPIGSLPVIGDSRCGHNCGCVFEYSYGDQEAGQNAERELTRHSGIFSDDTGNVGDTINYTPIEIRDNNLDPDFT